MNDVYTVPFRKSDYPTDVVSVSQERGEVTVCGMREIINANGQIEAFANPATANLFMCSAELLRACKDASMLLGSIPNDQARSLGEELDELIGRAESRVDPVQHSNLKRDYGIE